MNLFLLSQVLVGIAIITDFIAMHSKKREKILYILGISSVLIATHFVLIMEWIPAVIIYFSAIKYFIAKYTDSKKWMAAFLLVTVIVSPVLYEHWYSLLAIIAMGLAVIASFQADERVLRVVMMLETALWITHNYFAGTPMGVVLDSFFLLNNIIAYYRFYIKKAPEESGARSASKGT